MGNKQSVVDYSIRAPYDANDPRFVKSFQINNCDPKEVEEFYKKYGFVIFDNVLNEEEISRSINDLWSAYPGADVNDPTTWKKVFHPFSFVGEKPIDGVQLWDNRQNANIYQAFKLVYEVSSESGDQLKEPLIACVDRGSIMLPTKGSQGNEDYKSTRIPHFDLNPYVWCGLSNPNTDSFMSSSMYEVYPLLLSEGNNTGAHGYPKLRAVLQLSESTENTGGFECLAGFNSQILTWCKISFGKLKGRGNDYGYGVPIGDPIEQNMQKITVRKGSLIIFSSELPHTMFPNESEKFRYAQYLRMAPLSTLELSEETSLKRKELIKRNLPSELSITEIGREVFMLDV
jgi:hypothetical protein